MEIVFSNIPFICSGRILEEAAGGKLFGRDVILVERQELGIMFIIN